MDGLLVLVLDTEEINTSKENATCKCCELNTGKAVNAIEFK